MGLSLSYVYSLLKEKLKSIEKGSRVQILIPRSMSHNGKTLKGFRWTSVAQH